MANKNHPNNGAPTNGSGPFDARLADAAPERLVWGIGDAGRPLAVLIKQSVTARVGTGDLIQTFEPQSEPFSAFRDQVCRIAEAMHIQGENREIEVKIILACWEHDAADLIDMLRNISRILDVVLAVERTLTLTLIIPPPTADVAILSRVYSSFQALEAGLSELPFLNSAFVYQLPLDVYAGALEEAEITQDLVELMSREFTDPDALESIHQLVYPALRNEQRTAGRRAAYSALGLQRLYFWRTELLAHLEARFQQDLLHHGLLELGAVSTLVMERTAQLADECVSDYAEMIEPYKDTQPGPESRLPLLSTLGKLQGMSSSAIEGKLDAAIGVIQAELEPLLEKLDARLRQAFNETLAMQGQNIASAHNFLECVEGRPAGDDSNEEASAATGLFKLALDFNLSPNLEHSIAYVRQTIEALAEQSEIAITQKGGGNDPVPRLDALIKALRESVGAKDSKSCIALQLLDAIWTLCKSYGQQAWWGRIEARELTSAVFAVFSEHFARLAQRTKEISQGLEQTDQRLVALRESYPWYKRLLGMPAAYRVAKRELTSLRRELLQEQNVLSEAVIELEVLQRKVIDEVLWPQLTPAIILDALRESCRQLRDELDAFSDSLVVNCSSQWSAAEQVFEVDSLTETTPLNRQKLDLLYQQPLGSRSWGDYAQQLLVFEAPRWSAELKDQRLYADCLNLRDHFCAGSEVLLARMSDYAADLFAPMRDLDVMDIIRLGGSEQAREFLLRILAKTEYLPELSNGMLPLAQEHGAMQRMRIIRCGSQLREKLHADFGDLIDANDRFLDITNTEIIDITVLRTGLPAFVLHVLNNARRGMSEADLGTGQDLWPQ